jgi:dihydropyrimidinase
MSLVRWSQVCSTNAADIFGLSGKGRVAVGFDADIVVFDPEQEVVLEAGKTLHENVDWTPYAGTRLRGWTRDVVSRGRIIVREGEFVGRVGEGGFVPRAP